MQYQANTKNNKILDLPTSKQQQLSFIDFSLLFKGHLTLSSLQQRFDITPIEVKEAFECYEKLSPNQMTFDEAHQRYFQIPNFKPLFNYDPRKTLIKLANQISDGFDAIHAEPLPIQTPSLLNMPDITIIARLVQAIMNGNAVNMIYTSLTSGSAARDFVPHSIVDNGLRWHVRGYDRKTESFRDFVLTRISKVSIRSADLYKHEIKEFDHDWNTPVILTLKPHPKNIAVPTAIEMDYGMIEGSLTINTNAALTGYLLRRWNVDCSEEGVLSGPEYQLWLSNRQELPEIKSFSLAPGF